MINWLTIKLMQYQLKKVHKQLGEQHPIVKRAYRDLIKSYETTIRFLQAKK